MAFLVIDNITLELPEHNNRNIKGHEHIYPALDICFCQVWRDVSLILQLLISDLSIILYNYV